MYSIVNRYIAKLFIAYFAGTLIVMALLFMVITTSTSLMSHKPTLSALLDYFKYATPSVIYQMLPVAAITSTIFTLGSMNRSNELVALFASGFSLTRIVTPILVLVLGISVSAFLFADRVLPAFNQKKNFVEFVEIRKQPGLYSTVKTNKIWYRSKNIIFNLQTLDTEAHKAQGVTFYYFDQTWKLVQLINAKALQMNGSNWDLADGSITLFTEESSFPLTQTFKKKSITIYEDTFDLTSTSNSSDVMSLEELRNFIRKNKAAGLDTTRYEVDFHAKFGFGFAGFVMSLIGIPFSVSFRRTGGRALSMAACLGFVFVYWALYSSGLTLGRHGTVPPIIAVWFANVAMSGLSIFFLLRLKK